MTYNLKEDLCWLTQIDSKSMSYIVERVKDIICYDISQSMNEHEKITEIDVGIGTLYINIDDTTKYKFIPNDRLISEVQKTIKGNNIKLNDKISYRIAKRIENAYKELL